MFGPITSVTKLLSVIASEVVNEIIDLADAADPIFDR